MCPNHFSAPDHFGPPWRKPGGPGGHHAWFGGFMQARRGDMQPIILGVLTDGPMHGYEIMRQLEDKSHGMWRPSPGSVYPTLQLLEEKDLVVATEKAGKKVYALTDKGREEAKAAPATPPWETDAADFARHREMRELAFEVLGLFKQITHRGSDEQTKELQTILLETKEKLAALVKK